MTEILGAILIVVASIAYAIYVVIEAKRVRDQQRRIEKKIDDFARSVWTVNESGNDE